MTRRTDIGREWLMSFSGGPVRDEQGRQTLAVVITRDITEKKLTQAALAKERLALDDLRELERRKDECLITVAEPVVIVNSAGLIEYANDQAHRVLGYARGELCDLSTGSICRWCKQMLDAFCRFS